MATDLRVARVTAPASASFGQTVQVQFVITNAGTAPAATPWTDRIYISQTMNALTTLLTSANALSVPLSAGTSYTNTLSVTLPLASGSAPGQYFIVVSADHGDDVPESDELNNLRSAPIVLSLPPMPDLAVVRVEAPATAQPGGPVALVYAVTNQGAFTAGPVWSETLYLSTNSTGAGLIELATLLFTNSLPPATGLTRTQSVTIPAEGLAGSFWLAAQVDSRNDVIESNENNNIGVAPQSTLVPAVLTLRLSGTQINEGASQPIIATVTRNGSRTAPLTVNIANGGPTELSVPAQVTIPAGSASASFNIMAILDGVVDGPKIVTVNASAAGFVPATAQITVLDVDLPELMLRFTSSEVLEGQSMVAQVERNYGSEQVVVTLASSSAAQLSVPATVTIPANQMQAQFTLQALDDTQTEPVLGVNITASANGYRSTSGTVNVLDDDWPELVLAIAPAVFSEGAGPQAARATLTRSTVSPRALEVELESSNTNALRVPRLVTIPASETSVSFNVSAVDNDRVDGEKTVEIRSWFRASRSATRLGQGTPATVTVTDDDGPTLRLAVDRMVLPEGQSPAATGTVTRNTSPGSALVVSLISGDTNELVVPPSVTIPAGEVSATFPISTADDDVTDGNKPVTITATAAGFTAGSIQVTVTDVNLPDLVVSSVTVPSNAQTETYIDVAYTIRNQGMVPTASTSIVQRVYLSTDALVGDDILMGQFAFNGALPADTQFAQTLPIHLPQTAGDYWVIVATDANNSVVELLEDNNLGISITPVRVVPAYTAVVSTDIEVAPANTPVPMKGMATLPDGKPAAFSLVNIHISVRGTTRTIAALTDSQGRFATSWQPLPGEAGFYEIAAGHPGEPVPAPQDRFYLLGMKAQPAQPSVRLSEGSSV
ncbi:MAG: CARDB domain-containing protein, partial [Verrucomicrobiia bacterium]